MRRALVDGCLFVCAVAFAVVEGGSRAEVGTQPAWLFDVDMVTSLFACAAIWLRRRWPVELAIALVIISIYSEMSAGAMLIALFTVAIHRPPRIALGVLGLSITAIVGNMLIRPDSGPWEVLFPLSVSIHVAVVGWGLFIHHRRQLKVAQRDRVARAAVEAGLRAEQAQLRAREEIARELHDVLGHRLSLLSVHAGALEYRPDAPAEDIVRAAAVIRESAHRALQDLRDVVGVLRAPVGELPQPTLADARELVAESARAGMPVELVEDVSDVPERIGRTAYRIVQEGLTNARKHAPGAAVTVRVAGAPGEELTVEVIDAGEGKADKKASGRGLIGLAERVELVGGKLEYGPRAGGWRLSARLPWPS